MVPNCYFCKQQLERFKDPEESGNYSQHFVCYNCPEVGIINFPIWNVPCCVLMDNDKVSASYLYFHNISIWIHTFYFDQPFTDIKDKYTGHIFRTKEKVDALNISPKILEQKIKTWITFS